MKDKLDDETKFAGLESMVQDELEKHLILKSNRLRTFEDARLEVVTLVEAKFGVRLRDSKPCDTGSRGHSDPMDVDAVSHPLKGKGSSSPRVGCLKCGGAHFQRDCSARKAQARNRMAKANRASNGPIVCPQTQAKVMEGRTRENPKDNPKKETKVRTKVPKVRTRATDRKLVSQVWSGMMIGVMLDGTKVGNKRMTLPQSHFHVEVVRSRLDGRK